MKTFDKIFKASALAGALYLTTIVLVRAQDPVIVPPSPDELNEFLRQLLSLQGLGGLGVVAVAVQGLMLFFRSQLANFASRYRLLIVTGLSMVGGVVALKLGGMDWLPSLLHSTTLAAMQVFLYELYKEFMVKKA